MHMQFGVLNHLVFSYRHLLPPLGITLGAGVGVVHQERVARAGLKAQVNPLYFLRFPRRYTLRCIRLLYVYADV